MASLVSGWLDLVSAPEAAGFAEHDGRSMSSTDEAYFLRVRSVMRGYSVYLARLGIGFWGLGDGVHIWSLAWFLLRAIDSHAPPATPQANNRSSAACREA